MVTTKDLKINELKKLIKEENLLPFNRQITKGHVRKMMKSIVESDIIRDPLIGRLCYDKNKLVIVDGQHLVSAIVNLSSEKQYKNITCKIKDYETKSELIRDISKVNNVQKRWTDQDYLNAWYRFGPSGNSVHFPNYSHLWTVFNQGNLPIGLTIDIYTTSKDQFKVGDLSFYDVDFSDKVYSLISDLKREFDCPSLMLYGVLNFCKAARKSRNTIDFDKLSSRLMGAMKDESYDKKEDASTRESFKRFVRKIYNQL